ncbi:MAG: redoxin domain-containing protein [Bacteroidales bacterium]|nr:redoxin domain-containing protein [Bacteroidales bacterium]
MLLFIALAVLPVFAFGQDEAAFANLDAKVDEYLAALETQPTEVKCTETDFIIAACTDSVVLTRVANRVYQHYLASKLMGDDAVAIHIFDTWFADKAVKMNSDDDYFAASFFAAVNRSSLIGQKAPQLQLYTPENELITLFDTFSSTHNILFFYDVGCPTCRAEIVRLKAIYEKYSEKLSFYAVYVGSEAERWAEYRNERFNNPEITHLWDPELKSGLSFDYGVIGTPKLFLISPDGTILGRNLDSTSLEALLEIVLTDETFEYGSQESMDMYDNIFADPEPCANVSEVAAHIEEMLLPRGDTLLFKQMTGDLLYFLTSRKEARFKCGSEPFIDGYILNRSDIWNTPDDSLRVVELARFVKELLNLCPIGEKLPALDVPAEVLTYKGRKITGQNAAETTDGIKSKTTMLRLDKQKNCAIMFYSDGCGLCAKDLVAARDILKTKSSVPNTDIVPSKIILIDMDGIWSNGGELPEKLFLNFDLSALPYIICLDKQGRTAYKYADFN